MGKKKLVSPQKEFILALLFAIITIVGILGLTGTVFSGWHFVDDHETVRIAKEHLLNGATIRDHIKQFLISDFSLRWRPLYWLIRILMAHLLGMNCAVYNILLAIMGVATYLSLYYLSRYLGTDIIYSHIFSLLVLQGRQFEVWFRISNQENLGLFLIAVSIMLIIAQRKDSRYNALKYNLIIGASVFLAAFIKESFLILIPGIILFRFGLEYLNREGKNMWQILCQHLGMYLLTGAAFLFSLYMILNHVGTSMSYVGIDEGTSIQKLLHDIWEMRNGALQIYIYLAVICLIILIVACTKNYKKVEWSIWIPVVLFGTYIMAVEVILYAKSDMWDRYMLPFIVGFSLVIICFGNTVIRNSVLKILYAIIVCVFLANRMYMSVVGASDYAGEGKNIQKMMAYIEDSTSRDSIIITAFGESEKDMAADIYFHYADRNNVYQYKSEERWEYVEYEGAEINILEACTAFVVDEERNELLYAQYFNDDRWTKKQFGNWFYAYIRKD